MTTDVCSINHTNRTDCENAGCYWWQTAGICSNVPEPSECTKKDLAMQVGDLYADPYGGIIEYDDVNPNCPAEDALAYIKITTPWGSTYNVTAEEIGNAKANYFVYSNNGYKYAVAVKFMCGMETAPIIATTCYWQEELPLECIDYNNQVDCEANGCYWWSNDVCHDVPEETTSYIDMYIKPYPWYTGGYEEALNSMISLSIDISGALTNVFSFITDLEYIGIDILEDLNKNYVIIRIYLKEIKTNGNVSTLVAPIIIGGVVITAALVLKIIAVITLIIFVIGVIKYVSKTDLEGTETQETKLSDVTEALEDTVGSVEEEIVRTILGVDLETAERIIICIRSKETEEEILDCLTIEGIEPTDEQITLLITNFMTVSKVIEGATGNLYDDPELAAKIKEITEDYEQLMIDFESGEKSAAEAAAEVLELNAKLKALLNDKAEEQRNEEELEDCYIINPIDPTKCLLTDKQATYLMYGGIIVGGLYILSVTKPIISGAGKVLK